LSLARAGTSGNANGGTLGATSATVTGGTLLLSAANALGTNASLVLNGGTYKVGGAYNEGTAASVGRTGVNSNVQGIGNLTLTANSALDFGTGGVSTQVFGTFTDTVGATLAVSDFSSTSFIKNGVSGLDGTDDRLVFDVSGGLSTGQLADISFDGSFDAAEVNLGGNYWEVAPVPEPATVFAALALVGLIGCRERRRLARLARLVRAAPRSAS
jgi:hypothetical protein